MRQLAYLSSICSNNCNYFNLHLLVEFIFIKSLWLCILQYEKKNGCVFILFYSKIKCCRWFHAFNKEPVPHRHCDSAVFREKCLVFIIWSPCAHNFNCTVSFKFLLSHKSHVVPQRPKHMFYVTSLISQVVLVSWPHMVRNASLLFSPPLSLTSSFLFHYLSLVI